MRDIADDAPRIFANQARARIAEIEAEQRHQTEAAERQARERAESERQARERAETEKLAAPFIVEGRVKVDVAMARGASIDPRGGHWFKPGSGKTEWFKDLKIGPVMVVVPAGQFMMGEGSGKRYVTIERPFAIGRFTLTFEEWDTAQSHPEWQKHSGITPRKPNDHGWGRGKQPAIDVSWDDAKAYCRWLSAITSKTYRLPTEAEWEHACRAGTATKYSTGDQITKMQAQFSEGSIGSAKQTVNVGSFPPNNWGLHDMHGNVWEWCEDIFDKSSSARVLRGGCWLIFPGFLGSADRLNDRPGARYDKIGFRVARTLLEP